MPEKVTIDILFSTECPHVTETRREVERALRESGVADADADVRLVRIESEEEAAARGLEGSPTVRVNGRDVLEHEIREGFHTGCREYPAGGDAVLPYPPAGLVAHAIGEGFATRGGSEEAYGSGRLVTDGTGHAAPWDPRGPDPRRER